MSRYRHIENALSELILDQFGLRGPVIWEEGNDGIWIARVDEARATAEGRSALEAGAHLLLALADLRDYEAENAEVRADIRSGAADIAPTGQNADPQAPRRAPVFFLDELDGAAPAFERAQSEAERLGWTIYHVGRHDVGGEVSWEAAAREPEPAAENIDHLHGEGATAAEALDALSAVLRERSGP